MIYTPKLTNITANDYAAEIVPSEYSNDDSRDFLIFQMVKGHNGISAGAIAESMDISKATVLKVLRQLEAEREVYSAKFGNTIVWFPNGKLIHPYLEFYTEMRGKPYKFSIQEGKSGPLVQIQERSYSLLDGEHVDGAIFIEFDLIDHFIDSLNQLKIRLDQIESTGVKQ